MKIVNSQQTKQWDKATMERQAISSLELMERAATACFEYIRNHIKAKSFHVFCGPGNNGGDGLALARLLAEALFPVSVYLVSEDGTPNSTDNTINLDKLKSSGIFIRSYEASFDVQHLSDQDLIIDAVLGLGQNRPLTGLYKSVAEWMNSSNAQVLSIDVPTGLYRPDQNREDTVVLANITLTFEVPKLPFLLPDFEDVVGKWECLPIGLDKQFARDVASEFEWITKEEIISSTLPRKRFAHKGVFGKAALIAGSYGMSGAAILSAKAALRAGVGKLFVFIPGKCVDLMQTMVPEAIVKPDPDDRFLTKIPENLTNYTAIGIGPGIGKTSETRLLLGKLLKEKPEKLVLDADALTIIAGEGWQERIPEGAVLTPHLLEATRLWGSFSNHYNRLMHIRDFCKVKKVFVVLKGANTAILSPDGVICFNSSGNSGLAKAGTGDVLTGMIISMIAQGYDPLTGVKRAVFLHGQCAEDLAEKRQLYSFLASDLVDQIGKGKI